jgi:hypothetical protein
MPASSPRWELSLRCDQLLLSNFKRCLIHGDLSALVIKGNPPQADIVQAWANIYSEYIDLSAGTEKDYALQLEADLTLLFSHISDTETCTYILSILPHFKQEAADILYGYGYKYPWNKEDVTQNKKYYDIINNRLASKRMNYTNKEKELKNILKVREGGTFNDEYFDSMLDTLASWRKVAVIHDTEITVMQFIIMLRNYVKYVDSLKAKEDKYGKEG